MKKDYTDDSWVNENEWKYGKNDELGAMNQLTDASVLKAIALIKKGTVYDLETVRFKGMNIWDGHAGYEKLGKSMF